MVRIFLYTDTLPGSFDIDQLISFLSVFDFRLKHRGDLFNYLQLDEQGLVEFKSYLETIKIRDVEKPLEEPRSNGVNARVDFNFKTDFLDGNWLQRKLFSYMSRYESVDFSDENLHLVITGKLFGTYGDKRYHARVLLTGDPSLISTSGIVEAPAKLKEYYYVKANLVSMGKELDELNEIYKDSFVRYDDDRITSIVCSYALQQVKSRINGNPFCENTECCLYNSHWQEEVLNLQYKAVLCDKCRLLFDGN